MADAEEKISIIRNDISISHCTRRITKIISGVQTGADQAALEVAIEREIPSVAGFRREEKPRPPWFPKNTSAKKWKRPAI